MILMDYLPASDDAFYWAFLEAQPSIYRVATTNVSKVFF
tara:strand:- start:122 stop:238 length:117 start_codon:yes stop_codon:yes gene_type:complete